MVCPMFAPLPPAPSDCYGTRALACLGISISVTMFFLLYDAVAHRDQTYMPVIGSIGFYPAAPEVADNLLGSSEGE